jgi:hypothetical protein
MELSSSQRESGSAIDDFCRQLKANLFKQSFM